MHYTKIKIYQPRHAHPVINKFLELMFGKKFVLKWRKPFNTSTLLTKVMSNPRRIKKLHDSVFNRRHF